MNDSELIKVIFYTFFAFILMALVLILFFYFSRKKIIKQEVEKKNLEINYQKELLHAVIVTQEDERQRIAQDLHDDISSKLNIVSLNSQLLIGTKLTDKEYAEVTTNIINLTRKALENSRRIAHDLLPPVLEKFGLDAGISELAVEFNSSKAIKVYYENNIDFSDIHEKKHLHIFRILQELLNNSLKHSNAKNISIVFNSENDKCVGNYTDNGVGFEFSNATNLRGLGMRNIFSRVELIGASITIQSAPNQGFKAKIIF
ncbi:MAG: sensor histidine kinase [Flavobacterium sp.]|nr:sensor histidine kinase [Flavobacterium sp.]